MPEWELRHDELLLHEALLQRCVGGRMGFIQRRAENRDRATASLQGLFVSRRIDPGGEAADDYDIALGQCTDEFRHPFLSWKRSLPGADHRDARRSPQQRQIAAGEELFRNVAPLEFVETTHDLLRIERHDLDRNDSRVSGRHASHEFTTRGLRMS